MKLCLIFALLVNASIASSSEKEDDFLGPNPKKRIENMMVRYRQFPHHKFPLVALQILEDLFIEANMARKEWPESEAVIKDFVFSEIETTPAMTETFGHTSMHYVALRVFSRLERDPDEVKKAANIILNKYSSPASKKVIHECLVNFTYRDFDHD